ncbi:hypothetical protein ABT336_16700 [Micromonospora sp. NPDC000207]|uniref:hypothetical protein n=1 Tax=Micromonospora sp. NPDC000207 TaxID=3154246 RepID=UPI003317335D
MTVPMEGVARSVVDPGRRGLLVVAAAALLAPSGCAAGRQPADPPPTVDPESLVGEVMAGLSPTGPYRDPDAGEQRQARDAAKSLLDPDDRAGQERAFGGLGFRFGYGVDPVTDRPTTALAADGSDERTWGVVLVDRSAPVRRVIEVPHPGFDINTELIGLDLYRRVPGSILLMAGAHRRAADGAADVAHNDRSLFHLLAVEFARAGLAQVQVHGFADRNLRGAEAVVSTGSAARNTLAERIADGLAGAGISPCRAWVQRCGQLEGTRNQQGRSAAELDAVFVHLELGWSVRRNAAGRDRAVAAVAPHLDT